MKMQISPLRTMPLLELIDHAVTDGFSAETDLVAGRPARCRRCRCAGRLSHDAQAAGINRAFAELRSLAPSAGNRIHVG